MKGFWKDVKSIMKDKKLPKRRRRELYLCYAKLTWGAFLSNYNPAKRSTYKNKLLGYNIMFFKYDDLLYLFKEIFIRKDYFFTPASNNPFIIDCGSNIGLSLIFYNYLYPHCKIIAFEPDARTFDILKNNIHSNNLSNVELVNKAVYNYDGKITFYYDPQHPGIGSMSTFKNRLPKESMMVDTTILSQYINQKVDFLKLDIEGAEDLVIEELCQSGKLKLINEMVIEYHHHIEPTADNFSNILKKLENHGFGYQLKSISRSIPRRETFQDILVYAYQKDPLVS